MTDFGQNASAAVLFVQEGQNTFLSKAETFLQQSQTYIQSLASFQSTPTNFSINFDFAGQLTPFQRPPAPTPIDPAEFALRPPADPAQPPAFTSQTPDLDPPPTFDTEPPTFSFGAKPVRPNVALPTAPARPPVPQVPDEPDYASYIPAPVTLETLNLPTFTPLVLPQFTAARPQIEPFALGDTGNFTPEQYVSALLDKLRGRVTTWMDGQEGLPLAIRRALFDRGRAQADQEAAAEEEQAYDDYAARGFSAPSGLLDARVDAIRQKAQDRKAEFNRDASLKEYDEALANMRLAVQSGLQLEGLTINLHIESQRLLLAHAQYLRDTAIAVLNARIAQFNAEMQGYAVDAQVFETRLKGELAKLEEVRLRLEGEKLKGDINESTVRLYESQWNAVKVLAEFYRTRVEAVKVQADANMAPIEIFKGEVQAYETIFSAYSKEWDGWRSSVEGETSKATLFRAMAEAFGIRSDSVIKYGSLKLDRERLRISEHQQNLEVFGRSLQRYDSLLHAESARLAALGQRAGAEAAIYSARGQIEQAASAAADRSLQIGLEAARARVDAQIEAARIRSTENVALQGLSERIAEALAHIMSQLAASTMSAVNYSANVSASDAFSHARGVSWNGDADDWNPSFV
jgi:hypothetical protein